MKTLWIVSGGSEAIPGIRRAREMGLHVVVSDGSPDAPGLAFADDRIIASTYDSGATVKAALEYSKKVRPIDGVTCIASDVPLTVSMVAESLGLPGIPVEAARLASNKLVMKNRFVEAGIPTPWFSQVESARHLRRLIGERGYPLVIKPVDSRGARGVLRLNRGVDIDWAYGHSLSFSPGGQVMAEEYVRGAQISTESMIFDDWACTPGFVDRNYEFIERFAPYMIENGGEQPSILAENWRSAVSRLAEDAGRAIGIKRGTVKGDMVMAPGGPMVIEVAARLSGGWFSTDQIPLATGVDFITAAIRLALGEEVTEADLAPRFHNGVATRYFFPEPGRVAAIRNAEKFMDTGWVHRIGFFVKVGDPVKSVTDHTRRAGFVITKGSTRQEAVERAEEVVRTVRIEMAPF